MFAEQDKKDCALAGSSRFNLHSGDASRAYPAELVGKVKVVDRLLGLGGHHEAASVIGAKYLTAVASARVSMGGWVRLWWEANLRTRWEVIRKIATQLKSKAKQKRKESIIP